MEAAKDAARDIAWFNERFGGGFPGLMGLRLTEVEPERVRGELTVRAELCTGGARMHGGAIMAFADTLGAVGTVLNLPDGTGTTTIESKTNFLGAAAEGERVLGECTPLHRGGTTMVWQTRITRGDGRLVAIVTQTQLVLQPRG
jgi:uncharacterized protein (TIGR00369 family)